MKTLTIRAANNVDYVSLQGPNLEWGAAGKKVWTGIERIKLHLPSGGGLVFDATPQPAFGRTPQDEKSPPGDDDLPAVPTLWVTDASYLEVVAGQPTVRRLAAPRSMYLDFHWANPLTPAGAGIWFRLDLQGKSDKIIVRDGTVGSSGRTVLWHAMVRSRQDPKWEPTALPVDRTFEEFADREHDYLAEHNFDDERMPTLLGGLRLETPWLIDLADEKVIPLRFGPHRQPGAAAEDHPVVATLESTFKNSPVSTRALGGAGKATLGRATLASSRAKLVCARAPFAKAGPTWVLDWLDAPGKAPPSGRLDGVSLPSVWRLLASHYPQGLAAARARSRFTTVPTRLEASAPATLRFEVRGDAVGEALETQLRQVGFSTAFKLHAVFGGAELVDGRSTTLDFDGANLFDHQAEGGGGGTGFRSLAKAAALTFPFARNHIGVAMTGAAPDAEVDWLLGGTRVQAKTLKAAKLKFRLQPLGEALERQPLGCELQLDFLGGSLASVGQDPEAGFETAAAWLERARPISVDLNPGGAGRNLDVTIYETASAEQSRLVRLRAQRNKLEPSKILRSDVAVVDPAPFTVVRVFDEIELETDAFVAEYTDDSESPAGWEYRAGDGAMTVVLPPQNVGEEMIKGRLALPNTTPPQEVPIPGKPFQYRLSPNARLFVDRTDIDTARAAPPASLRRHLGRRLGVTGLKVDAAVFELVYGAQTEVTAPGLRVAELDALVGRIPIADRLVTEVRRARLDIEAEGDVATTQRAYAVDQAQWVGDLFNRPSWWPLFRDVAFRQTLSINKGVEVTVRDRRETAHPFQIDSFASAEASAAAAEAKADRGVEPQPLRGGVDWLFQSPAIYEEFLRHETGRPPTSTEAQLEGVAFGPLGAEGAQTAKFANGKTIIISSTRQGHLESLVLMRIGRIAQYWNKARHVIVYQRSRRTAPRYARPDSPYPGYDSYDDQLTKFDGFMALRKVREYIEITQPRRSYADGAAGPPLAGALGQTSFETTVIPVKASWARDIDRGQIIPLRGVVLADEEKFFPRPKVFIEGLRALEKGGGLVANEVADPRQLLFFTSTRPEDGADTDLWPAWPDVDGALWAPDGVEKVDFKPSFRASRRQPDARRAAPGRSRFTLDLIPNQEAVNLMHGRQEKAIEARLRNVTVNRALPEVRPSAAALSRSLGREVTTADAFVNDKLAELRDYAREHARNVGDAASADHRQFVEDAQRLVDRLRTPVKAMVKTIEGDAKARLEDYTGDWGKRQVADLKAYRANAEREIAALQKQIETVRDELAKTSPDAVVARRKGMAAFQAVIAQAVERVERVSLVPEQALAQLRRAKTDLGREVAGRAAVVFRELAAGVDDVQRAFDSAAANLAAGEIPKNAGALDAEWRRGAAAAAAAVNALVAQASEGVSDLLGDVFAALGGADSAQAKLVEGLRGEIAPRVETFQLEVDEVPPFELGAPDWDHIRAISETLQVGAAWADAAFDAWLDTLAILDDPKWRQPVADAVAKIQAGVDEYLKGLIDADSVQKVLDALSGTADQLEAWLDPANALLEAVEKDLAQSVADLMDESGWKGLAGEFNAAKVFAAEALDKIDELEAALKGDVQAVADAVDRLGADFGRQFNETIKHAERAIVEDLKAELKKVGQDLVAEGRATALELTRALAGGVNTDSLECTREALGYYYTAGQQLLDVTRSSAILNDLGAASLNALSAMVPFDRLRDRLMPQLADLDFSELFPDLGGLKLEYLFPELRILKDKLEEYDWLQVRHGFDKERMTAWSDVTVDKHFDGDNVLFDLSPVVVSILDAHLQAHIRVEISEQGQKVQDVWASIKGDWQIGLSRKAVVTVKDGELIFGNDGKFDFKFDAENVVLAQELDFITQALKAMLPQAEGLLIVPLLPAGVSATLALPLPDLGTGAFSITGVTLYCNFGLQVSDGFEIKVGAWLSRPDRPFGLAVLFLGGGGWFGVDVSYRPPGRFLTRVSVGIAAGAFVALNLAFCSGSCGLLFTAGVDFYQDSETGKGSTAVTLGLLIWGEFSILCIASAYLRITASITYQDGAMTANGRVSVSIRISFFYTLRVNRGFTRQFAGKSRSRSLAAPTSARARLAATSASGAGAAPSRPTSSAAFAATLAAPASTPAEAINLHYQTLDLP